MEADEFLRALVALGFGGGGVALVPGVGDGLGEKVDPAAVGRGEGEGRAKGGGGDVDGRFVELERSFSIQDCVRGEGCKYINQNVTVAVFLL